LSEDAVFSGAKMDIVIVDYGMGNLRSVEKAFTRLGCAAQVTSDPEAVNGAKKIVLPGVGAFGDAMRELRTRGLIEPLLAAIAEGRPFLGICLGLQVLFEESEEAPRVAGLGVLSGTVKRFQTNLKVPHMGWNTLRIVRRPPILEGITDGAYVYFVHSYYVEPLDDAVAATITDYGIPFTSMIWRGNLFATQFHPEKSQAVGLQILRQFGEYRGEI
jgi:glutamine amidotransferase